MKYKIMAGGTEQRCGVELSTFDAVNNDSAVEIATGFLHQHATGYREAKKAFPTEMYVTVLAAPGDRLYPIANIMVRSKPRSMWIKVLWRAE